MLATCSTPEKAAMVRALGADHVLGYADVAAAVRRLTGGAGVDVVYDSVGQATFAGSLAALRRRGVLVSYGQSSGPVTGFEPAMLSQGGSLYLTRPTLADYIADRDELAARSAQLFTWVVNGELDVLIHREYPLADAAAATPPWPAARPPASCCSFLRLRGGRPVGRKRAPRATVSGVAAERT